MIEALVIAAFILVFVPNPDVAAAALMLTGIVGVMNYLEGWL